MRTVWILSLHVGKPPAWRNVGGAPPSVYLEPTLITHVFKQENVENVQVWPHLIWLLSDTCI